MGLRERKKQRTADAIEEAALKLFARHGYAGTTVAQLAAAADISPRTFFGYFPSKESVLFRDTDLALQSLRVALQERAAGETAIDALRGWILILIEEVGLPDKRALLRQQIIDSTPALLAHERVLTAQFEALLAEAVATDFGDQPSDLRPRLVAAAAAAALVALRPDPAATPDADLSAALDSLDQALEFIRGGIAALR